jgi:predicted aminopeptidase
MEKKYFFVMASDGAINFQPTGQFNHKFFGVADVDSQEEYDRLKSRGCRELTKEEYDEEFKKKAQLQSLLDDFRPVMEVSRAQPAASKATPPEQGKSATLDSVRVPSQVPTKKS